MTTQEAYEQIRAYFSRPDAKLARDVHGVCRYRDPITGSKCAVGCLLPTEMYDSGWEGRLVATLTASYWNVAELLDGVDIDFLKCAQDTHDTAGSVAEFVEGLDNHARNFGLKVAA